MFLPIMLAADERSIYFALDQWLAAIPAVDHRAFPDRRGPAKGNEASTFWKDTPQDRYLFSCKRENV